MKLFIVSRTFVSKEVVSALFALCFCCPVLQGQKLKYVYELSKKTVEIFDFQEITLTLKKPDDKVNPFRDAQFTAAFTPENGQPVEVEGFCDAADGSVFKVRFMPAKTGVYTYATRFVYKGKTESSAGTFTAVSAARNGPLRIDPAHPWHFIYENTGEHYFWNSTTTYWILGWKDESVIREAVERLARYKINRIRVGINARAHGGSRWSEPAVVESEKFTFKLNPWVAARPGDLDNPGFDVTRFNLDHWQKLDRLVAHAREKSIVVSLIFYVDGLDHGCDPFKKTSMGNDDEQRYYRFAAARYGAFENIMWDIANEYHLFRTPEWAEKMGALLKNADHGKHLISVHGNADFPFRKSPWVNVVMFQSWDECGGYEFITQCRAKQAETGRILPQINEEYGYEGHYPPWGCGATAAKTRPDGRSADNRRRLAWEICMAGGYQTTGETAEYGTGGGEDTGGGWINGRGNEKMTMLKYYAVLRDVFEKTEYWKLSPRPDLVNYGNLCLADEGREYLVYSRLQHCRVRLPAKQRYSVQMINPRTGETRNLPDADSDADNNAWQYRQNLEGDWVFVLKRK